MKTGTTTLGIVCKDGILIAADNRMTAGNYIMGKDMKKIHQITDNIAVTIAGTVSDIQHNLKLIKAEINLKSVRNNRDVSVKEAANLLSGIVFHNIRTPSMIMSIGHFIMAGKDNTGNYLYDISPDGAIHEISNYVSSGSGSIVVYGVLETSFKKDMTINQAKDLAVKSISAAIQRDSASGNGIDVYAITEKGVEQITHKDLNVK